MRKYPRQFQVSVRSDVQKGAVVQGQGWLDLEVDYTPEMVEGTVSITPISLQINRPKIGPYYGQKIVLWVDGTAVKVWDAQPVGEAR